MNQEDQIRLKLYEIVKSHAASMAEKISINKLIVPYGYSPKGQSLAYIVSHIKAAGWTQFHSKWKRYLNRVEIKRHIANLYFKGTYTDVPIDPSVWCGWRNIPGFYSIADPLNYTNRTLDAFVLDIPRELGDKILLLNNMP